MRSRWHWAEEDTLHLDKYPHRSEQSQGDLFIRRAGRKLTCFMGAGRWRIATRGKETGWRQGRGKEGWRMIKRGGTWRERRERKERRKREKHKGREKNDKERWRRVMSLPLYQRIKPVGWWNSDEGNGTVDIYIRGYWWSRDTSRLYPVLLFLLCLFYLVYNFSLFLCLSFFLCLLLLSLSLDWQSVLIGHYILIQAEGPQPWVT